MDVTKILWCILLTVFVDNGTSQKALLCSSGCTIPRYNLTFKDDNQKAYCGSRHVFLRKISEQNIQLTMTKRYYSCCYSYIHRSNSTSLSDRMIRFDPCVPVKHMENIPLKHDFLNVQCFTKEGLTLYDDYFAFTKRIEGLTKDKRIPSKGRYIGRKSRRGPDLYIKTAEHEHGPMYNVLVLGMGAMSRARAYNSLNGTVKFFKNNRWLDFRGYNKIARNTIPNFIALLTGRSEEIFANKSCYDDYSSCNKMFLWHEFQTRGYVTAYGEDLQLRNGTFHRNSNGFSKPPTNHYMRPLFLAGERSSGRSICTRRITSGLQILNYILDYLRTYERKGIFGFFFINSFSRDVGQSPKPFDKPLLKFFKRLKVTEALSKTFVIFFSDHGVNHGPVRFAPESYYDERLPMLFMHIPHALRQTHKFVNLEANQHVLVSPYDVYLTIWDMLKIGTDELLIPKAQGCPKCVSLFRYIPDDRSCSDAGISDEWCTCHGMNKTSVSEYGGLYSLVKATSYLKHISSKIPTLPCTKCHELTYDKHLRIDSFSLDNVTKYYVVVLKMSPGNITYEVTVGKVLDDKLNTYNYDIVEVQLIAKNDTKGFYFHCTIDKKQAHLCLCENVKNCTSKN